jgi:Tfp pilus assembly protein PilO
MRRNELTIGLVLAVIGLIAAFWLIGLSPKRDQAATLKQDIDELHSQLEQAEQEAAVGRQERKTFPGDYRRLVVLGKAVPEDGDQPGLLVQLQRLADRAGVRFQNLDLSTSASSATAAAPTSTTETSTETSTASTETTDTSSSTEAAATGTVATATEASAAILPIGASVGPAGLPLMPYQLKFTGGFFEIADFLKSLDAMVHASHGAIDVHGRLLTVDGFALKPIDNPSETGAVERIPSLSADLSVTTYLTPGDEGATGGAGVGGPAPVTTDSATSTTTTVSPSP